MARLIDADAFLKRNEVYADCEFDHPKYQNTLREIVNEEPSVDAVEVVHGRWIGADDFDELIKGSVVCSNCGGQYQSLIMRNNEIEIRANKTPYCPNCGAIMDGEVKSDGN